MPELLTGVFQTVVDPMLVWFVIGLVGGSTPFKIASMKDIFSSKAEFRSELMLSVTMSARTAIPYAEHHEKGSYQPV